jgi:cation diffusion facilitator CzcD-associated flavoprotein CzcO
VKRVPRDVSVAIVGAGLGGIAAAMHAKRAGASVTVFEQSAGPGGTWWDNTYPGVECDIEIAFYAYSFAPRDWARTHASGKEIQAYVQSVIDEYGLGPHIRYGTRVEDAIWNDLEHYYSVTTSSGETHRFDVVVSALGLLNVPRYPQWPGLETFAGPKFHTARWEHQHDLHGKRVAVVGVGSTASQVVPAIAPDAGGVTVFVREAAYVMPKNERDLTPKEKRRGQSPLRRRLHRLKIFLRIERAMSVRNPKSKMQHAAQAAYRAYRDRIFAERPDLRELMSPAYPFACKRPILSSDFLPALTRDNVRVVPRAVVSVSEHAVVDDAGEEHPADVLVMATGFQPWEFLKSLRLVGTRGRSIKGVWGDQPEAYLGMQVSGFPNFFMMYGPNTNFMCVTFMLERQAEYIARAIKRLRNEDITAIDVRRSVMDLYNRAVQRALSGNAIEANCHSYYHTATGKNVVTWPWWGSVYVLLTRVSRFALTTRRAGTERAPTHLPLDRSTSVHAR